MKRRVVVANPGGQRHLREVAEAFAEVGELQAYVSTVGFGEDEIPRLVRRMPAPLRSRASVELRRRAVSGEVGRRARRVATGWELANVLLNRSPLPERARMSGLRPTRLAFDRGASRTLTAQTDAVIGYQGAAATTFRAAREMNIATVLDYPIAHYEFAESVLQEEARLVPEYASTMRVTTYPEWVKQRYVEEIEQADRIIMVSGHHRETFERAGVDPARTFTVPWYVDSELFTPPEQFDDKIFRVAFLGQITQRKGISYLVEGFRRAALPDSELLLIGMAVGERPWATVPGVRHAGAIPHFLLPEQLRGCHVIALPSLVEGFPIAVLEGMACGLPAIISENIGHDIISDGVDGWVVPIRDPDAIAERLRTLHADSELRARMSRAARTTAEGFTRERNHAALRDGVATAIAERVAAVV